MMATESRGVHLVEIAVTAVRAIALTAVLALSATLLSLLYFQWGTRRWSLHTALDLGAFLTVTSTSVPFAAAGLGFGYGSWIKRRPASL